MIRLYYSVLFLFYFNFSVSFAFDVRVLINEKVRTVSVEGDELVINARNNQGHDNNKDFLYQSKTKESILIRYSSQKVEVERISPRFFEEVIISAKDGTLKVEGTIYKGSIKVFVSKNMLCVVNVLNLEDYLLGVVPHEISPSWPDESIKAQAVIARTYALKKIFESEGSATKNFDLKSTYMHQVYKGMNNSEKIRINVEKTKDEVITYGKHIIEAFYHSCCGGLTELPKVVWGGSNFPYYETIKCKYCIDSPYFFWDFKVSITDFMSILTASGYKIPEIFSIVINKRNETNRVSSIKVKYNRKEGILINSNKFRDIMGYNKIKSTGFKIYYTPKEKYIQFLGTGSGHGVGLCQWGAQKMSTLGKSYREIINYYYKDVNIVNYFSIGH